MTEHLPECPKSGCPACYERGQRDALDAAVKVVEAMNLHGCRFRFPNCNCIGPQVIAAIDALLKKSLGVSQT